MYKIFVIVLIAMCSNLLGQDCNYQLSLTVIDEVDKLPCSYSSVVLLNDNRVEQTNENGVVRFKNLCKGDYKIQITHLGNEDTVVVISINGNENVKILMSSKYHELEGAEKVEKHVEQQSTQTQSTLTDEEMNQSKGKSLADALKNANGVTTLTNGSSISKPMIHGLQGYRVLILNNGIRQEGQQWGNEHAPEIDLFVAKKLSVIKGASSVRYGSDALAGVILVEPEDLPDTVGVTGEANLVGFSNGRAGTASGIVQGCFPFLKSFSWRLQGTVKKGGNVNAPNYFLKNTGYEEQNFSYAMRFKKRKWYTEVFYSQFNTKIGIFSGAHIGNLTDLQNAFQASQPIDTIKFFTYDLGRPMQKVNHELVKAKAHYHLALNHRLTLQAAWQHNIRNEFDKHGPLNDSLAALNKPELDYRITSKTVDLLYEHDNINSFVGKAGASFMNQENVYLGRFFIPNYRNNTWGVFAMERFVKVKYELEAGVRYDEKYLESWFYKNNVLQNPFLKFKNVSWNLGSVLKLDTNLNVLLNVGSAWRAPAVNELYSNGLHHGAGSIERGDANLKTERCLNSIATLLYKPRFLNIETSLYYNYFNNFICQMPGSAPELTIKGAFPVFNYKQANVGMLGFDAKGDVSLNKTFALNFKVLMIRAKNRDTKEFLIYMPADRLDLGGAIKMKNGEYFKKPKLSLGATFVNKQWRVPANLDFVPPPNAYFLVNIDFATTVQIKKQSIDFGIGINNLLNTSYRDYLDRFRYYTDAIGRNVQLRITVPIIFYSHNNKN